MWRKSRRPRGPLGGLRWTTFSAEPFSMDTSAQAKSQALVIAGQNENENELMSLLDSGSLVRRSIQERDQQPRQDVWEKLPHGGPYRKIQRDKCTDQKLTTIGSHSRPEDHWGYESVKVGPTTNFVGDAMSTKALELVRAELKERRSMGQKSEIEQLLPQPERAPDPPFAENGTNSLLLSTRELMRSLARLGK